jgi:hypothetical protein
MGYVYYFYAVDIKRKKNIASVIGFVVGMAAGIVIHHHGIGVALGIILALAMREIFDRR